MEKKYIVLSSPGTGSTIVEAILEWKKLPYSLRSIEYEDLLQASPSIRTLNPVCELPIVLLPDGGVLTESAAMAFYFEELVPNPPLFPPLGSSERKEAIRWLIFLVASLYPTFTYGDIPAQWVTEESAQKELRTKTDEERKAHWRILEEGCSQGKWWLSSGFSILDVYIAILSRWRPGREWFKSHCPRLHEIALRADAVPTLRPVWERNFPT